MIVEALTSSGTKGGEIPVVVRRRGERDDRVKVARVETPAAVEFYFRIRSPEGISDLKRQATYTYRVFCEALEDQGASPSDIVTEKIFFREGKGAYESLRRARATAYGDAASVIPVNFLHQPPAYPGRLCELQAFVVLPKTGCRVNRLTWLPESMTGTEVDIGGVRHIHMLNAVGTGNAASSGGIARQTDRMFEMAEVALDAAKASFNDVIRTWIYLRDLKGDYDAFNPVRTAFFKRVGVERIPASTGIQGATFPWNPLCAMDLYALVANRAVRVERLAIPTMNEAPVYGSAFSRGMSVSVDGRKTLYLSGTASIDNQGCIMHEGDIDGQVNRMLDNVEQLLQAGGSSFDDAVSGITYLKDPSYLDPFYKAWDERGLPHTIPNAVSIADVCRPDWLCEMEVIATTAEA